MANIKDVARASGVSPTTVSFVLNNTGAVGPVTRERVLRAAKLLRYHPSAVARGLLHKRMNTVGVVFSNPDPAPISNPYFAPILDGITLAAGRHRQNAMLFTGQAWSDADHSLPFFSDGRCDGLILVGMHTHTDIIPSLLERGTPFVLINNRWDDARVSWVDSDDEASAFAATGYLLSLGHRRIAMLAGEDFVGCVGRRNAGYRSALAGAGLAHAEMVLPGGFFEPSITERLKQALSLPPSERPTALLCTTDAMAVDAVQSLLQLGIRVPEDVSVIAHDDTALAAACPPGLTAMRQPFRRMGERAVDILLTQIENDAPVGCRELFPTELIVRQSVAQVLTRNTHA